VTPSTLIDTGPLLALIDARDKYHSWVRSQFAVLEPPLATCDAVWTEACFLAQRELRGTSSLWGLVDHGVVRLSFSLEANWVIVSELMRRYSNVPMSLADACLVRMSEIIEDSLLLTLDNDFRIYRRLGRKSIPLLIPPAK
jgi:predicted nucleic acid-binding protein